MDGYDATLVWHDVGVLDDIRPLRARTIVARAGDIAVFRTSDDRVFALRDRCPHRGGKLSQGIVHDGFVTCPLHGWVLGLADGAARAPDEGCAERIAVRLAGRRILLGLAA